VHQKNTALTVQWSSVDYATAVDIAITSDLSMEPYESGLLDPSTTSYTIPATFFDMSSLWYDVVLQ